MPIKTHDNRGFFYLLLAFAGLSAYWLLEPYLATIIFSIVVVVMFNSLYHWFLRRTKNRESLSISLTLLTIFLTGLVPLVLVINVTVSQAIQFKEEVTTMVAGNNVSVTNVISEVNHWIAKIPFGNIEPITEEKIIDTVRGIIQPITRFLADRAVQLGSSSADLITKFIIFLTLVGTLFPKYPKLIQLVKDLSPLDDSLDQKYLDRMIAMTRSMVTRSTVLPTGSPSSVAMYLATDRTASRRGSSTTSSSRCAARTRRPTASHATRTASTAARPSSATRATPTTTTAPSTRRTRATR